MRLPSYLQKSKFGIYYFRICFTPAIRSHINKWEFKRSLRTRDKNVAIAYSKAISVKVSLLLNIQMVLKMDWLATKQRLNELVDEVLIKFRGEVMEHGTYGDHVSNYPELLVEQEAVRFIDLKSKKLAVDIGSFPLLKQYAEDIIENVKLNNDPSKLERNVIQVAEMLLKLRNKRLVLVESMYESAPFLFEEYKKQIYGNATVEDGRFVSYEIDNLREESHSNKQNNNIDNGLTLKELIDKFIEYKKSKKAWGSPKTIELNTQKLNYIFEFFTSIRKTNKIIVKSFEASDAIQFEKYFQILPKNRTKKYPKATIGELIEKSQSGDIPISERISSVTYNSYVDLLNGLFNYASQPKQGFIDKNIFIDLKVKTRAPSKRLPFDDNDIKLFFSTELYQNKKFDAKYSWRYWIPIIMAYSALRLEEASQLLLDNILEIDGIYCFNVKEIIDNNTGIFITRLKNESSERVIPIHPQLIKIGFVKYVDYLTQQNESKLFPDLSNSSGAVQYKKAGAKVSRFFNEDDPGHYKKSYLTSCGINSDSKPRKVLYAFRHSVQAILNNHTADIENDKIDKLFGHATKSIGRKFYGGYSPETILKVVKLIQYPNSQLPWIDNKHYNKIPFPWDK